MKLQQWFRSIAGTVTAIVAGLGIQASAQESGDREETLSLEHPRAHEALTIQKNVTHGMMQLPGVLGTAVGVADTGEGTLVIYVDRDHPSHGDLARSFPAQIRGAQSSVNVRVELTDKFVAYAAHTAKQSLPIQLGTSGGWSKDLANGYCCGGTLGALVKVNGIQYIMSNYHVFESDIVAGGNGIIASSGDPVIQPGLIDANCSAANAQSVGTLVKLSSLPNSNVDVSLAQVTSGKVNTTGAILEIGTISKNTVAAALRQKVKKSGRTTGLTSSTISGLNASISVAYENECAGGVAFTKIFTGQIVVSNSGSKFLNAGDSGSLMVENVTTNPRAVGLLYAGSTTSAIANPIGPVLSFIGGKLGGTATMVGN